MWRRTKRTKHVFLQLGFHHRPADAAQDVIELRNDGPIAARDVAAESYSLAELAGEFVFATLWKELRAKVITISGE